MADRHPYALVADDDAIIRMDTAGTLEDAGFRPLEASHSGHALELLRAHHADVVLVFTDVEMPGGMDGFALARRISVLWPHIGILVASGRRRPGRDDMPAGARFVAKPFGADVVYERLKEVLPDERRPDPLKD